MLARLGRLRASRLHPLVLLLHSHACLSPKVGDLRGRLAETVETLDLLVEQGTHVDNSVFYDVLKRCNRERDFDLGSRLHSLAVKAGHESNAFLANHFICMFASHGRLEEANRVFTRVPAPNRYMWASIILAHVRHGQSSEAIDLYKRMRGLRVALDNHVFAAILKACATSRNVDVGKQVHSDILRSRTDSDMFLHNCLVDMYVKCGSLEDARRVFDNLPSRDAVTWTTMIAGYAQHGLDLEARILFSCMQQDGISLGRNTAARASLLQACGSIKALHLGKQLHAEILEKGLQADVLLGNCLVDMYAKCGSLADACIVFDSLPVKDVVTWNILFTVYGQNGLYREALSLYVKMTQDASVSANQVTYVCLLHACAAAQALDHGKILDAQIEEEGLSLTGVLGNCLLHMYAKCGSLQDARSVFDRLQTRDVVTWNSMISGYTQNGCHQEALDLYASMQKEGVTRANKVTYVSLLQSCASLGALLEGKQLHAQIWESGLEHDMVVGTCLVNMYAKLGSLDDACRVFENLPHKNVVTWTALIAGFAQHGLGQGALTVYARMQLKRTTPANHVTFVSLLQACSNLQHLPLGRHIHGQIEEMGFGNDFVVSNSLVDMYSKCGSLEDARKVFDSMVTKNAVAWTAMISAYSQYGLGEEALALHATMEREGMIPTDARTFVSLLQACASVTQLDKGKQIHRQIRTMGLDTSDLYVANALIDMYGKCGSMVDAQHVFDALTKRDIVTWNAILAGHARHGECTTVFDLFRRMQLERIKPDDVTFLSVLSACNHSGLVDEGLGYFRLMSISYGIPPTPEHYNCIVDLLGRAGHLLEAKEVLDSMPFELNGEILRSMLSACRKWNVVEFGNQAFECALRLDKNDSAAYVLMSSIYACAQLSEKAEEVQSKRAEQRSWKKPGQSWWADMGGEMHTFAVGDREHPERAQILQGLGELVGRVEEERAYMSEAFPLAKKAMATPQIQLTNLSRRTPC